MYIDETQLLYMEESKYKQSVLDGLKKTFGYLKRFQELIILGTKS